MYYAHNRRKGLAWHIKDPKTGLSLCESHGVKFEDFGFPATCKICIKKKAGIKHQPGSNANKLPNLLTPICAECGTAFRPVYSRALGTTSKKKINYLYCYPCDRMVKGGNGV